jgi:hypothetical protein
MEAVTLVVAFVNSTSINPLDYRPVYRRDWPVVSVNPSVVRPTTIGHVRTTFAPRGQVRT